MLPDNEAPQFSNSEFKNSEPNPDVSSIDDELTEEEYTALQEDAEVAAQRHGFQSVKDESQWLNRIVGLPSTLEEAVKAVNSAYDLPPREDIMAVVLQNAQQIIDESIAHAYKKAFSDLPEEEIQRNLAIGLKSEGVRFVIEYVAKLDILMRERYPTWTSLLDHHDYTTLLLCEDFENDTFTT